MKRSMTLLLLCGFSVAYAGDYQCMHLKIRIKNNTSSTCYLSKTQFNHGAADNIEYLPQELLSGQESLPFSIHEDFSHGPSITLTYVCGEGKYITIKSEQPICRKYTKRTKGTIISSEQIDAQLTTTNPSYFGGLPGTINGI